MESPKQPNFQVYQREYQRVTEPTVTIRDRGVAVVNATAWELIGKPEHVLLLFDPDQQILGIQGVPPDTPNSFPLTPASKRDPFTRNVSVRGLFRHHGVEIEDTRRYRAESWYGNTLLVNLREDPITMRKKDRSTNSQELNDGDGG